MAELNIVREHTLGLAKARKVAFKWAEQVEQEFDMQCTYAEGRHCDEVDFVRAGVNGKLTVTKDRFELYAQLGFLLGAFKGKIEAEIVKNLDALLASSTVHKAASETAENKRRAKKV
jgi:putative polyhydroxyalkanoate system protein